MQTPFFIHHCKPGQAAQKPTYNTDSCYQQFLCVQNYSNTQTSWVIFQYYSTAMPTVCLRDQNLCTRYCTNTEPNNNPCGRDKQSKGILGDTIAITNSRINWHYKPIFVFHQHFCNREHAIWKIQTDFPRKAQGDPWQHWYNYYSMSCANAAGMAALDSTFIASGVIFNIYSLCLPLLCDSSWHIWFLLHWPSRQERNGISL